MSQGEPPARPRRPWTPADWVAAAVWIGTTSAAGSFLFFFAGFAGGDWGGSPAAAEHLRTAALWMAGAGASFAAGPLGVWLFRRTRPWLIAAIVLFVVGGLAWSVSFWIESLDAPTFEEIFEDPSLSALRPT